MNPFRNFSLQPTPGQRFVWWLFDIRLIERNHQLSIDIPDWVLKIFPQAPEQISAALARNRTRRYN